MSVPAAAAAVPIASHGEVASANAAPVDESGITFGAYRYGGLPPIPGQDFFLNLDKRVASGPFHFAEEVGDEQVPLGAPSCVPGATVNGVTAVSCQLWLSDVPNGVHTYLAVFEATAEWDALTLTLTVDLSPVTTTVTIETDANPVQANHPVTLYAHVNSASGVAPTGTITWLDADSDTVIGTFPANDAVLSLPSLPVGTHTFVAEYSGDEVHASATSDVFELTVIGDQVDASNVGVEFTTFYPVDDGYRDTVAIQGSRNESISVSIKITSPTGSSVKSKSIAAGTGDYSYRWNGRNSAGTILASGKYKVVQTLTDANGAKKSYTNYVTLSKKRLVTKTKYIEKVGSSVTAKGSGSGGSVSTSSTGGYAKLTANNGWATAGWEFYIPSATVYKTISFQVYAKATLSAPPNQIAVQNFKTCPRVSGTWYDTCFERWKGIGNSTRTTAWFSTGASSSSSYRSGRYVRGLIDVVYGTVYVYKARAKVVYGVLE